jgi:hypothetical protein
MAASHVDNRPKVPDDAGAYDVPAKPLTPGLAGASITTAA